jgi:hypothetical protein
MQADAISGIFRSTPATFIAVVSETGFRGLWRGTSATVTRLALGAGAHFFFLDLLRPHFEAVAADGTRTLSASGAALTGVQHYCTLRECTPPITGCQDCLLGMRANKYLMTRNVQPWCAAHVLPASRGPWDHVACTVAPR